jgi:alkylated DNA repair protein (DNA oxidative demethylase)
MRRVAAVHRTFNLSILPAKQELAPGAYVLRGFAIERAASLLECVRAVEVAAPFRHMSTPGGHSMSAAMTNCGACGWVSDRSGYRYDTLDPASGVAWPAMPPVFLDLAHAAAAAAGFPAFAPDACLINRYAPGARMGLHRDADESDFAQPIVSVSLGLPIVFQFGGERRSDPVQRVPLEHGDVVVFGGPARRCYHGVLALRAGEHEATGPFRFNLTLRRAR